MFTELWLIRHGETDWTNQGRHNGRTDIPLNARGRAQALSLRDHLADFDAVFASPLARALETATRCLQTSQITLSDALLEWDYGLHEGRTAIELRHETPGWTPWTHGFPGGESLADITARAKKFRDEEMRASGRVAVIAHGHILRVLAARVLGLPAEAAAHFALDAGSVSVLGWEYERPAIRLWNFTPPFPATE
jgi:probable phosphoglycerate mutase